MYNKKFIYQREMNIHKQPNNTQTYKNKIRLFVEKNALILIS